MPPSCLNKIPVPFPTRTIIRSAGVLLLASVLAASAADPWAGATRRASLERMKPEHLEKTHASALQLQKMRIQWPRVGELNDFRGIFHAHAGDSAHTGGTPEEMLADAKKAGVQVVFLSDHFRPPRDFMESWRGVKEGVLFIPGSESHGFLIHPEKSVVTSMDLPKKEFIEKITEGSGLIFLSHVEERPGHPMDGLNGQEIYNRHADAKSDMASVLVLATMMTDPAKSAELTESLQRYPAEMLAFQCSYPKVYLDKWDRETPARRLTGVAANDCHHNQVMLVKMVDEETVRIGTNVDEDDKMQKMSATVKPSIRDLTKGHKPGDILVRLDFDPYARSFHNSSTHILGPRLDEASIRANVREGQVYVSHDWICDPTGFFFWLEKASARGSEEKPRPVAIMGHELPFETGLVLRARIPVKTKVRILRDGVVEKDWDTDRLEYPVAKPGVYRVECWAELDEELRPWIYSNPIYIR